MNFKRFTLLLPALMQVSAMTLAATPAAVDENFGDCRVSLKDNVLVLQNSRIERRFQWNNGHLISTLLRDKLRDRTWPLAATAPDFDPAMPVAGGDGHLQVERVAASPLQPAHLRVVVSNSSPRLQMRRICQLFPDTPAIGCHVELRGGAGQGPAKAGAASVPGGIETETAPTAAADAVLDRLQLPGPHWQAQVVSFTAATDHHDNLVQQRRLMPYRQPQRAAGNLLALQDLVGGGQVWVLKQSPGGADQLAYPGYDFALQTGDIRIAGTGLDPATLTPSAWLPSYGAVVGVAGDTELSLLRALRDYQDRQRRYNAERDSMVVMNTWGDRNRDARMSEAFALEELKAGAALGISVLQLDDGWQAGLSKNSATRSGSLWEDWRTESWLPHPQRFPGGLAPVVAAARKHNMELGLWFNPSAAGSFAKWRRDADILIGLYRDHGIRVFKIDGIEVPDRAADTNLRRLLQRVSDASQGRIVVNLDVTAGRRPGYHYLTQYGNLFLQNRYTDWVNYYPYRTLRNLWQLARYVPPQQLQVEFLNIYRNTEKYADGDPFAPAQVPFDYAFAVTMMAQPLAFFEATGLPPAARQHAATFKRYRRIQADIHRGQIFPLGREPNGREWTGFQSLVDARSGYLLIIRERHQRSQQRLATWLPAGAQVRFVRLLGQGASFEDRVDGDGRVNFRLPGEHTYALYRYHIAGSADRDR